MSKKILVLSGLALLALASCNNGGGGSGNLVLSKLNVSNASSLFLGSAKNANGSNDTKKLFKITENGYVEEVTYTWVDEKTGEEKQQQYERVPEYVQKLDDTYVFVCFNNYPTRAEDTWSTNYFVNIKTNECYKYPNTSVPYLGNNYDYFTYHKGTNFPHDADGNIYLDSRCYVESSGSYDHTEIKKINVTNPSNIVMTNASVSTDRIDWDRRDYAVDSEGNCYYSGYDAGESRVYRVFKNGGGYSNITEGLHKFFSGYDGAVYDLVEERRGIEYTTKYVYNVIKINPNDGSVEKVSEDYIPTEYNVFNSWISSLHYLNDAKQVFVYEELDASGNYGTLLKVYDGSSNGNEKFPMEVISLKNDLGLKTCRFVDCSSNYLYLLGTNEQNNSVIVVVDPMDSTHTTHEFPGYDLYSLTIGANDTFTFNATRQSDGAIIVGTITYDAAGKPKINESSVTFNDKVESLIHL